MNNLTTAFFEIVKADKRDDGTLMVYGKATDDSLDIDQQICDPTWLDTAMPEWFKSGGNIREQHSSIAAGVAKEYEKKADGHYIHALVVDPISVKKVDTGVLKGFSIGIKSPRIVRDQKAANGRIVDGQIVEVSLVDRPANPNCQLVLAKSVEGESGMWKVEELVEKTAEDTLHSPQAEEGVMSPIEKAKAIAGDIVKFDRNLYETARTALAQLIIVEAQEMESGSDERYSLSALLSAIHCLEDWFQGEIAEGEVEETMTEEKTVEANKQDKSAEHKCLECGCNLPQDSHGRSDVTTAEMVTPDETPKSAEPTEEVKELSDQELPEATEEAPVAEETPAETPAEEEKVSDEEDLSEKIEAAVEQAVKSVTESLKAEITEFITATKAAETKVVGLEAELATAKSLAVAGGPKRTIKPVDHASNDLLVKAATYKAKADASTDPDLAKGYKLMAEEYFAKAAEATSN